MAKLLKLRRGTTSQHSSFTGAEGEVTVDTTKDTLVVHDGSTAGGHELLKPDLSNLSAGAIDNADVSGTAAIAGTKISPNFGTQDIVTTGNVDLSDSTGAGNNRVKLGTGDDLLIFHDGNNKIEGLTGYVKVAAINGSLFLDGNNTFIRSGDASEIQAEFNNGGAVELNHAGSKKLETTSTGIKISGTITGDDNHGLLLGNSQDFRIRHTGSHSEITDEGTGNLRLGSNQTEIRTANLGTLSAKFVGSGAVELNHIGSKKFETTSTGVNVTGNIIASGAVDAAGMTISAATPTLNFNDSNDNPDFRFLVNSNSFILEDTTNSANRLVVNSDGHVDVTGNLDVGAGIDVTGNITATGTASTGQITAKSSSEPQIIIQDSNSGNTGSAAENGISFRDGGGTQLSLIGHHSSGDSDLYFDTNSTGHRMNFRVGQTTTQLEITGSQCVFDSDVVMGSGHTVDGRDIAADGSKLDGIASGATNVTNNNQLTNGAGYITSASFSDVAGGGTFSGDVTFNGGANAALIAGNSDISFNNGNWTGNHTKIQLHGNALYVVGGSSGIIFREGGNDRVKVDGSGHFVPASNNTYNLGSTSLHWSNVYTNDLHLSNQGGSNDMDGSWGDWTIQEGESDLFLKNNRSGKKYKFNLTEVS